MKLPYLLTPQALSDLRELAEELASESPRAAEKMLTEFDRLCERIAEFPASCRAYGARFRRGCVRNFHLVVFYGVALGQVVVVLVADGRRDPKIIGALLEER